MDVRLERVIARFPEWRGRPLKVSPLSGGITNQNFRVDQNGTSYVVRLAGQKSERLGIDRRREYRCAKTAAAEGLGPEVVRFLPAQKALVTRFVKGRPLTQTKARLALARLAAALRRLHDGPRFPGRFSAFDTVRRYRAAIRWKLPADAGRALAILDRVERRACERLEASCHNDLLPANFIDERGRIVMIDWEYAAMGDPYFDLGNLAANLELSSGRGLLKAYLGHSPSAAEEERLELFRLASDMREAYWGFLQAGLSGIDFDFMGYGEKHMRRFLERASTL